MLHQLSRRLIICLLAAITAPAFAAKPARPGLVFASPGGHKLQLDLYMPQGVEKPKLVVYIHGGGWRSGSRTRMPWFTNPILDAGYALASVDYRLSDVAVFPAQVHDCKAAIRYLRAHADEFGYDADRIVVVGGSAGGYLVLMLGLTNHDPALEGDVGGNLDHSSAVQAVIDFYGPTDFVLRSKDQPEQTDKPNGKVYRLLGAPVKQNLDLARQASPVNHLSQDDPPLLIFHGTKDTTVLPNQTETFVTRAKALGLTVDYHPVQDAPHGDRKRKTPDPTTGEQYYFATKVNTKLILNFLDKHLNP
ncbi:alpha/beta hydrolase [Planctomycetales bacterium ZRK34]|nr:alpha/beta hydrolase [Planctomycetales bacterium ZRK34]